MLDKDLKRDNRELKAEVARLNRLLESVQPFICKASRCEQREKANMCTYCGQIIGK